MFSLPRRLSQRSLGEVSSLTHKCIREIHNLAGCPLISVCCSFPFCSPSAVSEQARASAAGDGTLALQTQPQMNSLRILPKRFRKAPCKTTLEKGSGILRGFVGESSERSPSRT